MRWFKHITKSADDEKLAQLIDECGLAGYGFFWRVLELIAAQVDERGKNYCSYSKRTWCMKLAINHQTWGKMIACCERLGIYLVSKDGQTIRVESPNILKYRDEWTRKKSKNSGVSPAQRTDPDIDTYLDPDQEEEILLSEIGVADPGRKNVDLKSESFKKKKNSQTEKADPEFEKDSEPYRLAVYMRDMLVKNVPTLKEPNLQKWAAVFDVALRNDERMKDARFVATVIKWACSDSFWKANIQSPGKLREKFDQLTAKMESESQRTRASPEQSAWKSPAQRRFESNKQAGEEARKILFGT